MVEQTLSAALLRQAALRGVRDTSEGSQVRRMVRPRPFIELAESMTVLHGRCPALPICPAAGRSAFTSGLALPAVSATGRRALRAETSIDHLDADAPPAVLRCARCAEAERAVCTARRAL